MQKHKIRTPTCELSKESVTDEAQQGFDVKLQFLLGQMNAELI